MSDIYGNPNGGSSSQTTIAVVMCCCSSLLLAVFFWYAYKNQSKFPWLDFVWKMFTKATKATETSAPVTPTDTVAPTDGNKEEGEGEKTDGNKEEGEGEKTEGQSKKCAAGPQGPNGPRRCEIKGDIAQCVKFCWRCKDGKWIKLKECPKNYATLGPKKDKFKPYIPMHTAPLPCNELT
jgi:hypothetical protein